MIALVVAVVATAAAARVDVVVVVACVGIVVQFHWLVVQEVPDDYSVVVGAADYLEFIELEAEYATCMLLVKTQICFVYWTEM